jgi:HAD superfamily hydrolase (TIGR01490 family)
MRLALFDLDHTLIPFDSGMAWTRHLIREGALDHAAEARYLGFCQQYVACTLDIHAMVRASLLPLAAFEPAQVHQWRTRFEREIAAQLPASMRELVNRHRSRGDLCAIVTATERLVAEPFARAFGIEHLIATEGVMAGGRPTGEIAGLPCFREHKLTRVQRWLAGLTNAPDTIAGFDESFFYSDSINDLPLLEAVTHPVAVRPDVRLRALAQARAWAMIESEAAQGGSADEHARPRSQ